MNDFSKARHFLAVCLVLAASAGVSGAVDPLVESLPTNADYAVSSVVAGVGGVNFSSREFEKEIELSIGLGSDGKVRVNGAVVGSHNPAESSIVEVQCVAGVASVTVRCASTGAIVCSAPDAAVVASSDTASATGSAMSLDVSE